MSNKDRFDSGKYKNPTPKEINKLLNKYDLSIVKLESITGVDFRILKRWTQGVGVMPYSCWRLLLLELGEIIMDKKQ